MTQDTKPIALGWRFQHAIRAYFQGRTPEAWRIWSHLAKQGDLASQMFLGDIREPYWVQLLPGQKLYDSHTSINKASSCNYTDREIAETKLHSAVLNNLGAVYANGGGVPRNYNRAFCYFTLANTPDLMVTSYLAQINLRTLATQGYAPSIATCQETTEIIWQFWKIQDLQGIVEPDEATENLGEFP